ncbi:hypothetical protein N8084_02830 [Pelagibacteraceae bacterium]|nr:hypothetical protein [Pelagibacteraceae bacterium]
MNPDDLIGIIELGNKKIKCLICKINNNSSEILSTSVTPSEGIHNDLIINLEKATNAIRSCISSAERKAKISLKKIYVIIEQPDFLCTKFSKYKKINGSKIYKDDIEFLLKESKKQLINNDKNQFIIHIFNHNYIVDGKIFIEEPINIFADTLTHEVTFITMPRNNLKNINQAFIDCDIEIERLISRIFTLGAQLLDDKETQSGSFLIDLGFDKISLGLFKNFSLVHSTTFPFGIDIVKKDISKVCSLNEEESDAIKNNFDFLFQKNPNLFDENEYLKKNYFTNSTFRKISKKLITDVIKSRLDEITYKIKKEIIIPEFISSSKINLVISGEASSLINIDKYFMDSLTPNVKLEENNIDNKKEVLDKDFYSCLGALKIIREGWETEAIARKDDINIKKISFFNKIFGNN